STVTAVLATVGGCAALAAVLPGPLWPNLLKLASTAACAALAASPLLPVDATVASACRRRPGQFSLRTLLGITTLIAVAAAAYRHPWPVLAGDHAKHLKPLAAGLLAGLAACCAKFGLEGTACNRRLIGRLACAASAVAGVVSAGWV